MLRTLTLFSRWLLSKGKNDKVEKIYHKMAEMNNLPVTEDAINIFEKLNTAQSEMVRLYIYIYLSFSLANIF